jgi:hypothetical protein
MCMVHGLPLPSDIGLISVSVRGRTQGSPLHWFRTLLGFRFLFEATFSPNLYIRPKQFIDNMLLGIEGVLASFLNSAFGFSRL